MGLRGGLGVLMRRVLGGFFFYLGIQYEFIFVLVP